MCGFGGLWSLEPAITADGLSRIATSMADSLCHRGPDAGGVWVDGDSGVALGHRRLSIIDLSEEGAQPMHSAAGRYVIAYNGEIYNFLEIRQELRGLGHTFRGDSDTEVLLAAVERWGVQGMLERSVGMFAFSLWDRAERTLWLARDRMGEKPLYYGWVGDSLVFGSELKALARHPEWTGEIDRDALTLYLRHICVPAPYSIYRGISKLHPGHLLEIRDPRPGTLPDSRPYWSLADAVEAGQRDPFTGSDAEAVDALDALLHRSVGQQMIADVPLGAFLSGGVDSSAVVGVMQAISDRPVKTFTIGFHEGAFNEAEYAEDVARHLGTEHTELYLTPQDSLDVIPKLPTLYDEPFADYSQIPTFLVSELARRNVTVSLSGDGGDELFGGYTRYRLGPKIWDSIRWLPAWARRPLADVSAGIGRNLWGVFDRVAGGRGPMGEMDAKFNKVAELLRSSGRDDVYLALVSGWRDPEQGVIGGREGPIPVTEADALAATLPFASAMMYYDGISYLPNDLLVKVDRAAMGVSLETRAPMLDHRIVEFAWTLPDRMRFRDGKGKWILRQVLDRYVPNELVDRPKMGFGVPVSLWLRGPLREWAEELLDRQRLVEEGYFDADEVRRRWDEHQRGKRDWHFALWAVLMFQAWLEDNRTAALAGAGGAAAVGH